MKESPKPHFKASQKTRFVVEIEDDVIDTMAHSPEQALNNAVAQYAEDNDMEPALVRWKINQGHFSHSVEEAQ